MKTPRIACPWFWIAAAAKRPDVARGPRLLTAMLLGLAGFVPPVSAQMAVFVQQGGKAQLVRSAQGTQPYVEVDGKLVEASARQYALKPAKEYLPFFVAVSHVSESTSFDRIGDERVNFAFHFTATFESAYALEHTYLVLDIDTLTKGHVLFLYGIGPLKPGVPSPVTLVVPLPSELGPGNYRYHVFVDGLEALHSGVPPAEREAAMDHMVASRIAGQKEAPPKLFVGPNPEYPAALLKSKVKGAVAIDLEIDPEGRVVDPVVKSATDPAFGDAALAAVRNWRFLPRVHLGKPVGTKVEIPFNFTPPK